MKIFTYKFYGNISSWSVNSAEWIGAVIDSAVSEGYDQIDVHMHCIGGDVIEGNAITTVLENSPIPINCYIDGVAASMGFFILPYFEKVYAAKNAFGMVHAPRDNRGGTAAELDKTIKLLRDFEANFLSALAKKTGKTEDKLKPWLVGDNWLSAKDMVKAGIVDEITEPVAKDIRTITKAELKSATAEAIYERFSASINPKREPEMDKLAIIARYGLTGVDANSTEEQIYAAIDAKLATEKTAREQAEAKVENTITAQIDQVVDAAVTANKITAAQKPNFVAIGKSAGLEALNTALDAIKPIPSFTGALGAGGSTAAGRETWDWDKWQKEDSKGLQAMAESNFDQFNALYKAAYGVDAPR